jgi:GDPmannose 4,6-dehydratase
VDGLIGDATKAQEKLGWQPRTSFTEMVAEMVQQELSRTQSESSAEQERLGALGQHA